MTDGLERRAQQMNRARVLIADRYEIYRVGLRTVLADEPELEIVAEATDHVEVVEQCARTEPDLVLMDARMTHGLAVSEVLGGAHLASRVLITTFSDRTDDFCEAIRIGAAGVLLKDEPRHHLVERVRHALSSPAYDRVETAPVASPEAVGVARTHA